MIRNLKWPLAAVLAALLAACGGGGGDTTPRVTVTKVKVLGDSLADVGTFGGVTATVQGSDSQLFPDRVAVSFGLARGCNFFAFTGVTFVANPTAGCTNYAVGGGVINGAGSGLSPQDPRNLGVQFAASTAGGNFAATDLVVVDGGGNDAAALVGAYLRAGMPVNAGGDGGASYVAMLRTQLSADVVNTAAAGGAAGLAAVGRTYMTALADTFYSMIKTGALDKGAERLVLLNMPGITNTPRFQSVLDGIAAASGGGAAGATARGQSEALFKSWVEAFNSQLATRVSGNAAVALVDFYTAFNDQVAHPEQFGLSNVKTPACPMVGVGADGLPTYSFPTCTATSLSAATPPAGASGGANWWKTYAFSDGFHPTPYGHQLLAQLISRTLAQVGWL
jgi:outer membrane lipase/esterase